MGNLLLGFRFLSSAVLWSIRMKYMWRDFFELAHILNAAQQHRFKTKIVRPCIRFALMGTQNVATEATISCGIDTRLQ